MSSYAFPADLNNLALPAGALPAQFTPTIQQLHLDAASDTVDSYLADQVTLPLTGTIPLSIKMKVCQIAAYTLLVARGYNPDNGQDELMKANYDDAIAWLEKISKGEVRPPLTDSAPGGVPGGPNIQQVQTPGGTQSSVGGPIRSTQDGVVIGPPRLRGWQSRGG